LERLTFTFSENNTNEVKQEDNNGAKKKATPDFGAAYVPGAGPEQYAPKSLDHFKRGYEERAAQRDKEFYTLRNGPTGRGRSGRYMEDVFRDRPTVLQGLDINALVDRLSTKLSNKEALFADLDRTRQDNRSVFEGGKAMTALISVAARRKNIGLGHAVWDWMDQAGIPKNTFHYNSMISVTEKARDYQRALDLLKEMKERKIPKNEVT
jgi:pentatricopeptide repeat protein